MQPESRPFDAFAVLREDIAATRLAVERLEGRMDERMLRLEDRVFQTLLAVLGSMTAAFGAIVAAILS